MQQELDDLLTMIDRALTVLIRHPRGGGTFVAEARSALEATRDYLANLAYDRPTATTSVAAE